MLHLFSYIACSTVHSCMTSHHLQNRYIKMLHTPKPHHTTAHSCGSSRANTVLCLCTYEKVKSHGTCSRCQHSANATAQCLSKTTTVSACSEDDAIHYHIISPAISAPHIIISAPWAQPYPQPCTGTDKCLHMHHQHVAALESYASAPQQLPPSGLCIEVFMRYAPCQPYSQPCAARCG